MLPNGWRDIRDETIKAFFAAVAGGLAAWGVDKLKERAEKNAAKSKKRKRKAKKAA